MKTAFIAASALALFAFAAHADEPLQNGKIGYVLTNKNWAIYQTPDGKAECPNGLNDGPREQFDKLYPRDQKHNVVDSWLEREGEVMLPDPVKAKPGLTFFEAQGNMAIGLDLDGKDKPGDFKSPDGRTGVDNRIYRVFGCVGNYRGPDGSYRHFVESYMQKDNFNRIMMELSGVDDLVNDPDVTVTLYRGRDDLLLDAAGKFIAGGTQRVDMEWGKEFIRTTKGRIVNGVLTTVPIDITYPESLNRGAPKQFVKDWRVELKVSTDGAEGLMGGYLDIQRLHNNLIQNWGTHYRSYGQESLSDEYRSMLRNADAYPDKDRQNRFISSGWELKFKQVFIIHPNPAVAKATPLDGGAASEKAGR